MSDLARELLLKNCRGCVTMRRRGNGRYLRCWLVAAALILALSACAKPIDHNQGSDAQDESAIEMRAAQDQAAAFSDASIPTDSAPMPDLGDYPVLAKGPELTVNRVVEQVRDLANALKSQHDFSVDQVQKVLAIDLPPDASARRRGVQGAIGAGSYAWAVWKPVATQDSHRIALTLAPVDACLSFDAVTQPLLAEGFQLYTPTSGDDRRITVHKTVASGDLLFLSITVDDRNAPTCASRVTFEMEPRDPLVSP